MSGKLLNVSKVQLHCVENNKEHHTDDIATDRLIVRRGKAFQLTFHVEQPFQPMQDFFQLTFQTGPNASEERGTLSSCGLQPCYVVGKPWSMQLINSTATSFTVSICSSSNASIGLYSLSVKTGPNRTPSPMGTLVVLFNPWCEDDSVYLPNKEERQEYVMNEQGLIYRGNRNFIQAMAWDFGQFEDNIVDICLKLLDVNPKCLRNAREDFSARCNPIYVGRVVSAMINVNDDYGVVEGRWNSPYTEGVNPTSWSSSVDILRQWFNNACRPVKYGQCWVFAAVMCTVLRCLGIPCRVVTNFESAHDTNKNLLIEKYFNENGVEDSKDSELPCLGGGLDEAPDISDKSAYDGWQVLDPTPQEKSEGTYCCGPAPVKAILEGQTSLKYDVPFVFAEVNADVVTWIVRSDSSKEKIRTDTSSVGQFISTKAVGSDKRLDITNQYKYPEGSKSERDGFSRAMRNMDISEDTAITMKIQEVDKPICGSAIKLSLTVHNNRSTPQALNLQINAQTIKYNGSPTANIYWEQKEVQLQPKEALCLPINIPFDKYGEKMLNNNCFKITAIVKNAKDPKEIFVTEKDIVLQSPPLSITVNGTAVQNSMLTAEVVFKNPLPETINDCFITVTGSGLLEYPQKSQVAQLGPGQMMKVIVTFWPSRVGLRKLVADFHCSAFSKINASCNILVTPQLR